MAFVANGPKQRPRATGEICKHDGTAVSAACGGSAIQRFCFGISFGLRAFQTLTQWRRSLPRRLAFSQSSGRDSWQQDSHKSTFFTTYHQYL